MRDKRLTHEERGTWTLFFLFFVLVINIGFEVERLGCGNGVCVFGLECVCLGCWTFGCLELK